MKTVGFPISKKENEKRRAVVPSDLKKVKNVSQLYFEKGYGNVLGFTDEDYISLGANIASENEVLKCDIICDPKIGDAEYLDDLQDQTIFGWGHLVQNKEICDKVVNHNLTAYVWEDMFDSGRHVFWRNNELAGEAAIMHAFRQFGEMPYNLKVAVIGRGNVARGALRILNCLGATTTVYSKSEESLLKRELPEYDVVVNALLWDTDRDDHLITRQDLKRMKPESMIIDISCDKAGAIESSIPTTIEEPCYVDEGVLHYVVDHTPSLFYKTASTGISAEVVKYLDQLIMDAPGEILKNALPVENGKIIDNRIIEFQNKLT